MKMASITDAPSAELLGGVLSITVRLRALVNGRWQRHIFLFAGDQRAMPSATLRVIHGGLPNCSAARSDLM